jgi:hypothetical protein
VKINIFLKWILCTATALFPALRGISQKLRYERVQFSYYKLPQITLDSSYRTYAVSANIPDYMGGNYAAANMSYSLQHLKKAQTPADIEVLLNYPYYKQFGAFPPMVNKQTTTSKVNGQDVTTTTYTKSCSYEQPYEYKIINSKTGQVIAIRNNSWTFTVTGSSYATEAEANQNWENTLRSKLTEVCTAEHNKLAAAISNTLSAMFYKGMAGASVDVYSVKDKDYPELDSAYKLAQDAYRSFTTNKENGLEAFKKNIAPAIEIWERLLAQKEDSKKAHINPKVTALLLFNLAHAAYWQQQYDRGIAFARQADENGKLDDWVKNFISMSNTAKK